MITRQLTRVVFGALRAPSLLPCTCVPRRQLSTGTGTDGSSEPAIYVSDSHDPHFNLAFEDWIFRKTNPNRIILYMYRNDPSVIIGRNQNPWKEIDLKKLDALGIPFVRRKSGGGTVYHDLGNTNYCVFVPRLQFERRTNAELVSRALNDLDIPAFVNERNDICVETFKVSGSAFKLVNARAYHHGTMLIDARLGDLRGVLGTTKETLVTKGVASVSSPVRNLREWSNGIEHEVFVQAVTDEFKRTYADGRHLEVQRISESELERNEYVKGVTDELQSWDWKWGSTPEFVHDMTGSFPAGAITLRINSRHAFITSAQVVSDSNGSKDDAWAHAVQRVVELMVGDRYGTLESTQEHIAICQDVDLQNRMQKIVDWLKVEM